MSKVKSKARNLKLFEAVYEVVKKIPPGKVGTYGQIEKLVNSSSSSARVNPRVVGWALHANKDSNVPCHRVVDRNGRLAPNFSFGDYKEQKKRLLAEGIEFKDEMHVNLEKHLWKKK